MTERRARDLDLLDAIDAFKRKPFAQPVWRVAREGREPTLGAATRSRWCDGNFDVLYTSLEREGALAEIHALLNLQPVFPSKIRSFVHRLAIDAKATLRLADLPTLAKLGVDVKRYRERDYTKTQAIADAAYFLGFDGLVAPSARWDCLNAVLFTDRIASGGITLIETEGESIDWGAWRRMSRK
ncbi:RES family NAD+ phosphorylase [Methylocystis suflitae]|uniref:RES family NAD+ phosphorylase n=1 Tax=Methylocystis suflitae TaxID=2951405 RepID=UPI00210EB6A2|nr:RES family NAD+ phosphorylase [Methylocystis suflitae]MCQ4188363.1 RES family NAD+ phosphorylase [Methylocystis suflitae]